MSGKREWKKETHTFVVRVAQSPLPHIREFDGPFRARVHEPVAACRVKLRRCNYFCKLLHVCRFDIHNVEALVLNIQVPQVDPQIITAYEGLPVTVDRDAINVISMGVGVGSSRYSSDDRIMMCHSWEFQCRRIFERYTGCPGRPSATNATRG